MKILRGQFLGLLVLLCAALPLQGMFSSRLSKAMQQKKQQLQLKQLRQQKMEYSGVPAQPGWFDRLLTYVGLKKSSEPFVQQQFLPKLIAQPSSMAVPAQLEFPAQEGRSHLAQEGFSEQQEPFMQKEEDTTRRDEMFAFMEKTLETAKKYSFTLQGTDLSRIINKLYEYEDVLDQVKDGHTILGEIISLYGVSFKDDMNEARLFESIHHFKAERALNFFREVKKLGASNMTLDDFKEIENIKNDFISFLITRFSGAEELLPLQDILIMADVFEELKGESSFFWLKANKIDPSLLSYSSLIDIAYDYREDNRLFSTLRERNAKLYNDLMQLLKDAVASIFGLESEFYQNFINRLEQLQSYTDDEIAEIKKMRDKIRLELVDKKQQKLWQEWQALRRQKPGEKEEQQRRYQEEQEKRDEQKREQRRAAEEVRKAKEEAEQEERERRSPIELEILMNDARKEYIRVFKKENAPENEVIPNLSIDSSDKELDAVFKKWIKKLHPDSEGDKIKSQVLNASRTGYLQAKKAFDKSKKDQLQDQLSRE